MSSNPIISCQCRTVTVPASQPEPSDVYICHCTECRKQSSSAFGISAIFPAEGILPFSESVQPYIGVWKRPTDAGNTLECYFCKKCGVRLLHRGVTPDGQPKSVVSVKGGCLDKLDLQGVKHIFTRSAVVPVPEGGDPTSPGLRGES